MASDKWCLSFVPRHIPRLPDLLCVEKIGEPGDEATLQAPLSSGSLGTRLLKMVIGGKEWREGRKTNLRERERNSL